MGKLLTLGQLEQPCTVWFWVITHFLEIICMIHMTKWVLISLLRVCDHYEKNYCTFALRLCAWSNLRHLFISIQIVSSELFLPDNMNPLLKNLIEGLLCKGPSFRWEVSLSVTLIIKAWCVVHYFFCCVLFFAQVNRLNHNLTDPQLAVG